MKNEIYIFIFGSGKVAGRQLPNSGGNCRCLYSTNYSLNYSQSLHIYYIIKRPLIVIVRLGSSTFPFIFTWFRFENFCYPTQPPSWLKLSIYKWGSERQKINYEANNNNKINRHGLFPSQIQIWKFLGPNPTPIIVEIDYLIRQNFQSPVTSHCQRHSHPCPVQFFKN